MDIDNNNSEKEDGIKNVERIAVQTPLTQSENEEKNSNDIIMNNEEDYEEDDEKEEIDLEKTHPLVASQDQITVTGVHDIEKPGTQFELIEESLKNVIQNLFESAILVHDFDGENSHQAIINRMNTLIKQLNTLDKYGREATVDIPRELIEYVENGRNPDIYTRQFIELVTRDNKAVRSKLNYMTMYRDELALEMSKEYPELSSAISEIVINTGGNDKIVDKLRKLHTNSDSGSDSNSSTPDIEGMNEISDA